MIEKKIELMKNGYDPFLDYLKGFCILSVVLNHCLGPLRSNVFFTYWGQLAVPLFLLLQSYHVFRKDYTGISKTQISKMLHRLFLPFACVTALEFIIYMIFGDQSLIELTKSTILSGGIGLGSYYMWIYLQFFILIPMTYWFFHRFNISLYTGGGIFIFICFVIEFIYSSIDMRYDLFRLSCLRYVFLIYLGYVWSRRGIRLNALTLLLSLVSIVFLTIFMYTDYNLEPVFHNFSWKYCHWICYFYPAFLFMFILHWTYNILPQRLKNLVVELGHYSWHIFLLQMFFFAMFPTDLLPHIRSHYVSLLLFCCLAFAFSTIPVIALHRIKTINKTKI